MRKDKIYSLRLTAGMRRALSIAAHRDRRSVASLLEKIIADYLAEEGITWERNSDYRDRRRHPRKDVFLPARLTIEQAPKIRKEIEALVENMSLGGAYVIYANGHSPSWKLQSEIYLIVRIPRSPEPLELSCRAVRVIRDEEKVGVGLQYRKMGDKELSLIDGFLQSDPPEPSLPPNASAS